MYFVSLLVAKHQRQPRSLEKLDAKLRLVKRYHGGYDYQHVEQAFRSKLVVAMCSLYVGTATNIATTHRIHVVGISQRYVDDRSRLNTQRFRWLVVT